VVGLGLCVLDELLEVDDLGLAAVRTRVHARRRAPGGMVATALAAAARLGCRSELLTLLGDDPEGRAVLRALRAHGVSTRRALRSGRWATTISTVLVERGTGERRFLLPDRRPIERGAPAFDLTPVRRLRGESARHRSVLLVDGHFQRNALAAVRRARERGVPVVADLHDARPAFRRLLPYVDFPIVPEEFCASWGAGGPRETLRDLHRRYGGTPVVTLGARGALAWLGGRALRVPARRVAVRDTTGAGDVFHGAFAAALARGLEPAEALGPASRAAAAACTGLGGSARLLSAHQAGLSPGGRRRA